MAAGEGFFSRWSRQKLAERPADPAPEAPVAPPVTPAPVAVPAPVEMPAAESPAEPAPTLDDVARLAPGDEVSRFVRAGVEPDVQRAALKKLFADPHFNVMDGLDVYIDDYGRPDPIPESMLRQMAQSKFLRLFDEDEHPENAPQEPAASEPRSQAELEPEHGPATPADEDPDLQLQRDDPARRAVPDEGA
ncbi:DUF3306 domain-containing protein [Caldimonas sp. KR1-144]|uniref:DUF3306 domain-containing protein n=1 Tax=Caldimonas sp. KR1-144 TaxID=3400911 RepID=UPI003BFE3848